MQLAEYLIKNGFLTEEQHQIALRERSITRLRLSEVLISLGFVHRETIHRALLHTGTSSVEDANATSDIKLPHGWLHENRTIIKGEIGNELYIATLHRQPKFVRDTLAKMTGMDVKLVPAELSEIQERLAKATLEEKSVHESVSDEDDVNRIINSILSSALADGADDIHIEPTERSLHIRFRIDNSLYDLVTMSLGKAERLISRLKDRAGMDVSEKRVPQDGSFAFDHKGQPIDLRVASILTAYGEKMTIRILNKETILQDIRSLGLSKVEEWIKLSNEPHGLILVCGVTGSGKTTTLYSTLQNMDRLHRSVYTIEDPIEIHVPYVNQCQVNRNLDPPFDFEAFTKTILRHTPQVIIVGEVRDPETAENLIHLADTGHLVYGTLHTTDALSSINRLLGLGVDKSQLPLLLKGILIQRLARKVCQDCHGRGCSECRHSGYRGRTLLCEFVRFRTPEEVEALINCDPSFKYHTFELDASEKVRSGITNCHEIARISGGEIRLCGADSHVCISGQDKCKWSRR